MKYPLALTIALAVSISSSVFATVTIDLVTVGNPGNAADPLTGHGAVGYVYQIGKYEVTNAQYGAFLNAAAKTDNYGLYNTNMADYGITRSGISGSYNYNVTTALANRPVVYVSWFDAARFTNWLANGQGSSDTETGSYTLNGATSGIILAKAGAQVYIPTKNEWHKAAYYNSVSQSYSLYPNGQNSITTADANYDNSVSSSTNVGTYISDPSFYGTFDQGGNVAEWNDTIFAGPNDHRFVLGGAWNETSSEWRLRSTGKDDHPLDYEYLDAGIRLAMIPEPSSMILTMLAGSMMLTRRKR